MATDWSKYGEPINTPEVKQTRDWGEYGIPLDTGETQMGNKPTAVGGMIRDLAETPTNILQNVRAIGQTLRGDTYQEIMKGRYSPYLQKQIVPNSAVEKGSFGKAVGQGLELSSYLPITSGIGGVAKTSLIGKIGQGALNLGKEGFTGGALYAGGKATQEGKSLGDVIMDSLVGGVAGFAGGVVLGGVGAVPANLARTFSKAGQLEKYNNALTEFFTGTKRGTKIIADQAKKGKDVANFLTKYRNNFGVPQVENGKFNPSSVIENIYNTANKIESEKFTPLLKSTGEYTDLVNLLGKVEKNINTDKQITRGGFTQKALARANEVMNDYITTFGRQVPIDLTNEFKRANWAKRFPKAIGEAETVEAEVANIIGKTIKEEIEDATAKYFPNQATNPIKEINGILGDHYSAAKILNEFQGNVVGGGMFSKWLMRLTGAVAGSQGGPIGSLIGSVTADQLANMLQSMKFTNPLRDQILKTFRAEAPQVLKEAEALMRANINKRALPSPSGKPLGRLGQMDLKRANGDSITAFPREGSQMDYIGAGRKIIVPRERVSPQASKFIKDKEGLLEKVINSGTTPTKAMAMVAGIEQDEEGNITFNEEKAGLALALVFGGAKFLETNAGKKMMQEIKDYVVDFIENPKLGLSIEDVSKKPYKGEKDLTTKILKDLEGKTTVSKQYILDATNRGELKQVERDLIRQVLDDMGSGKTLYHGGPKKISEFKNMGERGVYLTPDKKMARIFAGDKGEITEAFVNPKKVYKIPKGDELYAGGAGVGNDILIEAPQNYVYEINRLKAEGYDAIRSSDGKQLLVFDPSQIKTKSDTINVKEFADKVKSELLPLKTTTSGSPFSKNKSVEDYALNPKYESISLPDELRGNVKDYRERIYQSPIKTSAGSTHFQSAGNAKDNYFGHTRIEDMADNKTRRVIEVQSDLYQKGNLEKEMTAGMAPSNDAELAKALPENLRKEFNQIIKDRKAGIRKDGQVQRLSELNDIATELRGKTQKGKLQQYNDPTAHFRMVREEIKKAAQDGKTKLQFPTGETALRIEGLGESNNWFQYTGGEARIQSRIRPEKIEVGMDIFQGGQPDGWIVTHKLEELGKFKAISKDGLFRAFPDIPESEILNFIKNCL